jgi:predicted acetyltransferase
VADEPVTIHLATPIDAALLSNLLELYIHDLSEVFLFENGPDGRFGYPKLPLYWSEPEKRFPFLIRAAGRTIGFAFVTRGSPATDDPNVLDIAEFFILRRHRRSGFGRRAASLLWERFPGRWIVRVSEGNSGAIPFWESAIRLYTGDQYTSGQRAGSPHAWRDFCFASPADGLPRSRGL